jgi:hypothetical protein
MADDPPESGTRLTAVEIHDNILEPAEKEMDRGAAGASSGARPAGGRGNAGGQASWAGMLAEFVVPSVIGNAIGGVLLVALLNYGQVEAEKRGDGAEPH